jgi:hypothetical protein
MAVLNSPASTHWARAWYDWFQVNRPTRSIDVSDLPEDYARLLEQQAARMRQRLVEKTLRAEVQGVELSVWDGYVDGELTRQEIYDDRV